jgi:hypothetical protein
LFAWNEFAHTEVLDRELVFAVGGKGVSSQQPAARSERQSFDELGLGSIAAM